MAFFMCLTKVLCYCSQNGKALGYLEVSIAVTRIAVSLVFGQQARHFGENSKCEAWRRKEVRINVEVYLVSPNNSTFTRDISTQIVTQEPLNVIAGTKFAASGCSDERKLDCKTPYY